MSYTHEKYLLDREGILRRNAKWAAQNREKRLAYWRARNRLPEINARRKPYVKTVDLPPELAEHRRAKKRANVAKHADKLKAYWKQYRKDHPEKTKAHNKANWHKRRALIKKATVNLTSIKKFILSVRSKPRFVCYYCGSTFPIKQLHFDHIVALSKGGPHSVENLCTACAGCNESKKDKHVTAWIRIGQQVLPL